MPQPTQAYSERLSCPDKTAKAKKFTVPFRTPAGTQAGGVGPRVAERLGASQQKRAVLAYFSNAATNIREWGKVSLRHFTGGWPLYPANHNFIPYNRTFPSSSLPFR